MSQRIWNSKWMNPTSQLITNWGRHITQIIIDNSTSAVRLRKLSCLIKQHGLVLQGLLLAFFFFCTMPIECRWAIFTKQSFCFIPSWMKFEQRMLWNTKKCISRQWTKKIENPIFFHSLPVFFSYPFLNVQFNPWKQQINEQKLKWHLIEFQLKLYSRWRC